MDTYDLITSLMNLFPATVPAIIVLCAFVTALTTLSTAFISFARAVVKFTFWTKRDDLALAQFEMRFHKIVQGPLKPIFSIMDRLSVLKDTVR
ncbi:hypothetical protein KAR91_23625 [Candidatus Pacearchaeota archaeon]|nr:hypothetical protein [Candidatus Pacearchaeota archaeon]